MKKRNVIALSLLALVLLSLGFFATPLMQHVRQRAWDAWVLTTARIFGIRDAFISDRELSTLVATEMENIRLKAELGDYRRIKSQLGAPAFDSLRSIPAQVIARPIDTLTSSYIINKGIADGISIDAPVLIHGSVLIGFTKELSQHSAVVYTLFHPSTSLTVETVPTSDEKVARGLLKTQYQTSLSMETIPRDVPIHLGQDIVTTSKGEQLPYGMVVGKVQSLLNPEHEAYQSAMIDVPYDSDAIDAVIVLAAP